MGRGSWLAHAQSGRMNARERIAALIDARAVFTKWAMLGHKGHYDAQVGRYSHTDPTKRRRHRAHRRRKVALHVDDYTIRAGSSEGVNSSPTSGSTSSALAHQVRMPLVRLVDSAGGSVKLLMQTGGTKIPRVHHLAGAGAAGHRAGGWRGAGACAGQGAVKVPSHFRCWCAGRPGDGGQVPRGAPGLRRRGGQERGWAATRRTARAPWCTTRPRTEADALAQVRRFLSYLPAACMIGAGGRLRRRSQPRGRLAEERHPRDRARSTTRRILAAVFDQAACSRSALAGRLGHHPAGRV